MGNLWLNRVLSKGKSILSGSRDGTRRNRTRRGRRRGAGSSADSMGRWDVNLNAPPIRDDAAPSKTPTDFASGTDDLEVEVLNKALPEYEILAVLDHGGQGTVYRATQRSTGRTVALKVLHHEPGGSSRREQRFAREVEIVARLSHPHVVKIFDSGVAAGRPYLSMELIDGMSVDDFVLLNRPSVRQCVELFEKICRAVASVHQHGVIHRDLKPDNILVDLEGQPHILDFGLAKCFDDEPGQMSVSVAGQVVGTLPFASPEQVNEKNSGVDTRTDIHALGVILHLLLTGEMPYPVDGTREELARNISTRVPARLERRATDPNDAGAVGAISSDLSHVVLKALAKDKENRYQSADALADDLRRYLDGDVIAARGDGIAYLVRVAWRKYRVHSMVAAAFVLLLAGSAVSMGYLWRRSDRIAREATASLEMGRNAKWGSIARDQRNIAMAIQYNQEIIDLFSKISDPSLDVYRSFYKAHHELTQIYLDFGGKKDQIEFHCSEAVRVSKLIASLFPQEAESQRLVGYSTRLSGRVALRSDRFTRAISDFRESMSAFELVPRSGSPEIDDPLDYEVQFSKQFLGRSLKKAGQRIEAIEVFRQVRNSMAPICANYPNSIDFQIELARTESMLAVELMLQKMPAADEEALELLIAAERRLNNAIAIGIAKPRLSATQELLTPIMENKPIVISRIEKRTKASNQAQLESSSPSGISTGSSSSSSIGSSSSDR